MLVENLTIMPPAQGLYALLGLGSLLHLWWRVPESMSNLMLLASFGSMAALFAIGAYVIREQAWATIKMVRPAHCQAYINSILLSMHAVCHSSVRKFGQTSDCAASAVCHIAIPRRRDAVRVQHHVSVRSLQARRDHHGHGVSPPWPCSQLSCLSVSSELVLGWVMEPLCRRPDHGSRVRG